MRTEKDLWVPTERVAKIIRDWMKRWEAANPEENCSIQGGRGRNNRGISAFAVMADIHPRKVQNILSGVQNNGKRGQSAYLNVSFDVVDRMLVNMGRVDLWHTELSDIYWAEDSPRRRECRVCKEIKYRTDFKKRSFREGDPNICSECVEVAA